MSIEIVVKFVHQEQDGWPEVLRYAPQSLSQVDEGTILPSREVLGRPPRPSTRHGVQRFFAREDPRCLKSCPISGAGT